MLFDKFKPPEKQAEDKLECQASGMAAQGEMANCSCVEVENDNA